jgi:ligand-binding SRPBCC domain-containing protein
MIRHLHREQFVPGDPARIWDFFAAPQNLDALTPPNLRFRIVGEVAPRMYPGQLIEYRIGLLPGVWTRWLTEITHVREGEFFVDEQRLGPYRLWHHEHHFAPAPDRRGVTMTDRIAYDPGWGFAGGLVERLWIRGQLRRIFDFRAARIAEFFPAKI